MAIYFKLGKTILKCRFCHQKWKYVIFLVVFLMILSAVFGMDLTTIKPETTTEDTSGRLLSLPISEKCADSKYLSLHYVALNYFDYINLRTGTLFSQQPFLLLFWK